jgi:pterin-4a-carbinolamine dehydratase
MNTQTAVEQKTTQYPAVTPGTEEPSGGAGNGTGTLPVPEQPGGAEQKLKSERVQEELKAMAGWAAIDRETAIEGVKTFATPEIAGLYGGFVTQCAAATGHPVTVSVNGNQVCVTVYTPDIDGCPGELTLSVLAFVRQLG